MARLYRTLLALVVLLAFAGGTLHVHPCAHASGHDDGCVAAEPHAPEPHGQPEPAPEDHHAHHCLCPCHIPAVPAVAPSVERVAQACIRTLERLPDGARPGFLDPPFRPPCA